MHRLQDARGDPRAADRLIGGAHPSTHPGQFTAGRGDAKARRTHAPLPRGRFAPSPTGPLHAGSLFAALAAHASVRATGGELTIRIDDLDAPRTVAGAEDHILATLTRFGLLGPRTPIVRQHRHVARYEAALAELAKLGLLYRCRCSRRELAGHTRYPGTCRDRRIGPDTLAQRLANAARGTPMDDALRVRLQGRLSMDDLVQGQREITLERDIGDIVVHRRDGIIAWPLATACDDAAPNTEVVRGADLFDPSPAQIALMERLGLAVPRYAHLPVLRDRSGAKLGKSTGAPSIDRCEPLVLLQATWQLLGQQPLDACDITAFHAAAARQFELDRVPSVASLPAAALDQLIEAAP